MDKNIAVIPFGKSVRVGNFKLWRSRIVLEFLPTRDMLKEEDKVRLDKGEIKLKKQKESIEAINISNLDESWMVRIPQTYEMFVMISQCYEWYMSDDEKAKQRGEDFLTTVFGNMQFVSSITNGYYQEGCFMVAAAYSDPTLLSDKKKFKAFKDEADGVMKRYLKWREEFDKFANKGLPEEEMKEDEQVQKIMQNIENESPES